jgi:glycosyltransferase involved in cell wall biosynthesis
MSALSYAAITPVRDEETNLARLAGCMLSQTVRPSAWLIVDNGSTDGTIELADELAREHAWVRVLNAEPADRAQPGAPIVRAFNAGLEQLAELPDVVVKLDADVSMEDDYFERVLGAFATDPLLGIAGGACLEFRDGDWIETFVTGDHVRGASRCYRRDCLKAVSPLEERVGWDGVDELKAAVLGWHTKLLRDVPFRHHRRVGERDGGSTARWKRQGEGSHFMGYRFSYLLLRSLHHARRDPAALAMVLGYVSAAARREPRYADAAVVGHLRDQQRLTRLSARRREATGRRAA